MTHGYRHSESAECAAAWTAAMNISRVRFCACYS